MTDVLTKQQRSFNMSQIKGTNTKPEIKLRKLLWQNGLRGYRTNYSLLGKPDVVFTRKKLAVFIDGCFWHKCKRCFVKPATRTNFWMKKIDGNVKRDRVVNQKLKNEGWKVLRFWEHQLKKNSEYMMTEIVKNL